MDDKADPATWPSIQSGRAGGGGVWTTPVVDPKDGLILFGTGNPIGSRKAGKEVQHSAYTGDDRAGANLFSDSIVGLDAKGRLRSYYQEVHHDLWDYDQAMPLMAIRDKGVDVVGSAGKTGYWYEFDAKKFAKNEDGAALFSLAGGKEVAVPLKPRQAGYQHVWPTQPELKNSYDFVMNRMHMWEPPLRPLKAGDPGTGESICITPGTFGGAEWGPATYDAKSGRVYLIDVEEPTVYSSIAEGAHKPPCKGVVDPMQSYIRAVDPKTGKVVPGLMSENLGEYPGGLLSTAGGLIFVGTRDGLLRAYGTDLKLVWSGCVEEPGKTSGCGFTVVAAPMAFTIKGKQYISVTAMSIVPGGDSAVFVYGLTE
jgi:glucose dehydrogenase